MSLRINLLPDARLAKLRNQRMRRTGTTVGVLVSIAAIGVVILILGYIQAQNLQLSGLQSNIDSQKTAIKAMPNLDKILSTQQRLDQLPLLYQQRTYVSEFFAVLSSVSPLNFAFNQVAIDQTNTLKASGLGKNYQTVAKLAEAMQAHKLKDGSAAFTNVSLGDLAAQSDGKVNFTISATLAQGATDGSQR